MRKCPRSFCLIPALLVGVTCVADTGDVSDVRDVKDSQDAEVAAQIGEHIFLDTKLSNPIGQGCISCHRVEAAFADPRPTSPGAVPGRRGRRNSPSLMYAALIPPLAYDEFFTNQGEEVFAYEGGLFHDGRARDLFEQVQQPFFDPNEMNLLDEASLASRLRSSDYAASFHNWVGDEIWKHDDKLVYHAYRALVEFLKRPSFRPFDAPIDDYLAGDTDALNESQKRGLQVFQDSGKCADCHLLTSTHWEKPLLSDFGYDNLGVPSRGEKDPGLAKTTGNEAERGQFRAPSLRNIALTAPYMHNGSIGTLREVMDFYNKRDVEPHRWGATDYPDTVNRDDLGNLKLSEQQIVDLVELMKAFTDRTLLNIPKGRSFPLAPEKTPSTQAKRLFFPDWTHRLHAEYPGLPDSDQ